MKKTSTLISLLLLMLFACTFTSCEEDEDTDRSMCLSGQWQGDWGMYYVYNYRGYDYTFDSYDTDIVFYPDYDYATHGYGYQVDWYDDGPYERLSYKFFWEVRDGVIYLTYPGYPDYNADIYRYGLDNDYFTGYFNNGSTRFRLAKIRDYYRWDDYYSWNYHYWVSSSWSWNGYYKPSRSASASETDSLSAVPAGTADGRIVKIGNRLKADSE